MGNIVSKLTMPSGNAEIKNIMLRAGAVPRVTVDSTSTSTAFTVTSVPGILTLEDGSCVYITNNKVTSASNCTLNVNGLGAKPIYMSNAASTRVTTQWAKDTTCLFVYNSTRVTDGCWDLVVGYDTNTTYQSKAAASGGTDVSLCTTGEKYTWNSKANGSHIHGNIQNGGTLQTTADITIASGDKLVVTDSSDSNKIARTSAAFGSDTTKYLRNDGSWAVPPDTKNTTGSTDTSSKIFLIGATSQAASPQTYSDNEVFATSGVLTTKKVQVGGGSGTMEYNSTTQSIDFVFA